MTDTQLHDIESAFRKHRRSLIAFAAAILGGNIALAEEVVSEVFSDFCARSDALVDKGNVRSWIMRCVRNKAIDFLRKDNGRQTDLPDGVWQNIRDDIPCADEQLVQLDAANWINKALAALNREQREVVTLCYFEGCSVREIAEIVECPPGTVKTRLFHARRRLAELLENDGLSAHDLRYSEHDKAGGTSHLIS